MKLYYCPNVCSLGIHLLLEEIGKPFELQKVDLFGLEQYGPEFMAINPKSKVPALLRDDGVLITEYSAVAMYLALANPEARLLPPGLDGQIKALELTEYIVATMHMRGLTAAMVPFVFSDSPEEQAKLREAGRKWLARSYELLAPTLAGKDYLLGEFSIADSILFYIENCAGPAQTPLPPEFAAHWERMKARPAVQRALATEAAS